MRVVDAPDGKPERFASNDDHSRGRPSLTEGTGDPLSPLNDLFAQISFSFNDDESVTYISPKHYKEPEDTCKQTNDHFNTSGGSHPEEVMKSDGVYNPEHKAVRYRQFIRILSGTAYLDVAGEKGLTILALIAPINLGKTVIVHYNLSYMFFLVSKLTLLRCIRGRLNARGRGVQHLNPQIVLDQLLETGTTRYITSDTVVYRYYLGLTYWHITSRFIAMWSTETKAVLKQLCLSLLCDMISKGVIQTPAVREFLSILETIHNPDHPLRSHPVSLLLRSLPRDLRVMIYRSRRVIFKDEGSRKKILQRYFRYKTEPSPCKIHDEFVRAVVAAHKKALETFLRRAKRLGRTPLKGDHKASSSAFVSQESGGANAEVALIVGLFRLSQGTSSSLSRPLGSLPSDPFRSMEQVITASTDYHEEILDAALWFLEKLEEEKLPELVAILFPPREPKSRSISLLFAIIEVATRPAITLYRSFLSDQGEMHYCFRGKTNYLEYIESLPWGVTIDTDAEGGSERLSKELCKELLSPIEPYVDSRVWKCVLRSLSPRTAAPRRQNPNINADSVAAFEDDRWTEYCDVINESAPEGTRVSLWPTKARKPNLDPTICPLVQSSLLDWLKKGKSFKLKAATGTGKSMYLLSQKDVVLATNGVALARNLLDSAAYFGVSARAMFAGLDLVPDKPYTAIVCTYFYVRQLCRSSHHKDWLFVFDEADSGSAELLLSVEAVIRSGHMYVLMTATPEVIMSDIPTFEFEGGTKFPVTTKVVNSVRAAFDQEEVGFGKTLVVTYSEPNARSLVSILRNNYGIEAETLLSADDLNDERRRACLSAPVIVSTNRARAGMNLPELTIVIDVGRRYRSCYDSSTGVQTLVLTATLPSERKQLMGRVGRTQPGHYIEVIDADLRNERVQVPPEGILGGGESIGYTLPEVTIGRLIQPINRIEVLDSYVRKWFIMDKMGLSMTDRGIFEKQLADSLQFTDNQRSAFGFLLCCYKFGIFERIGQRMRTEGQGTPRTIKEFYLSCQDHFNSGYDQTACRIITGWFPDPPSDPVHISKRNCRRGLALYFWQHTFTSQEGGRSVGKYFDLTIGLEKEPGHDWVILFPHTSKGMIKWLDVEEAKFGWPIGHVETPITFREVDREIIVIRSGIFSHMVAPISRSGKVYEPCEFDKVWERVLLLYRNQIGGEVEMEISGTNQASEISFCLLNGLALFTNRVIEVKYEEKFKRRLVLISFGDDLKGKAEGDQSHGKETLDFVCDHREKVGLMTKKSASGRQHFVEDRKEESLNVFTERFTVMNRDGVERVVEGPKPLSLVRLTKAVEPGQYLDEPGLYADDYQAYYKFVKSKFKSLNLPDVKFSGDTTPYRLTGTRRQAMEIILEYQHSIENVDEQGISRDELKDLVNMTEALILPFEPSTRGKPLRGKGRRSVIDPQKISKSVYNSIVEACETFWYVRESILKEINYPEED